MGILEKIKDIELEMSRTQKNKATESHLGPKYLDSKSMPPGTPILDLVHPGRETGRF